MLRHVHCHLRHAQPAHARQQSRTGASATEHIFPHKLGRRREHISQFDVADNTLLTVRTAVQVAALPRGLVLI
jgi:hypothetical protein